MSVRRYAAFLRGVSPMNAKMPELRKCFEDAGFKDVKTVRSSGNVVFSARPSPDVALARDAEAAMKQRLGRAFLAIVRPVDRLREILDADPYRSFRLASGAKRVVTFLRRPPAVPPKLPVARAGARVLLLRGSEAFTVYVRSEQGPVFMNLIEETFGVEVTTRTWDTLRKVAAI